MKLPKGTVISAIFLALPLILWLMYQPPTFTFAFFGRILAVLGFTAFTFSLLLSVRIPFQEKLFGDLGRSYAFHQVLGTVALMALVLHPVFLAWQYWAISPQLAALMLLPVGSVAKILGSLALYILTACIICTYYVRLQYHIWKTVHKFLGVAFIFGSLHSLLIAGDIQLMPALKGLFFIFFVLGVSAILYRAWFHKLFVKRSTYIVTALEKIDNRFIDVTLAPKHTPLHVAPGQYAYISYPHSQVKNEDHPFSIASTQHDGSLRFICKNLGDYTSTLNKLSIGDEARVEGPYGTFSFLRGKKTQCWIAGGIGITPFLSFAYALPDNYAVTLFYTVRNEQDNVVTADLEALKKAKPNIEIIVWNTEKQGYCTAKDVLNEKDPANIDVFLCGPNAMMTSIREQLRTLGTPAHRIHQESFSMLPSSV